ncbi:L-2-hydroxyglutarate oxidase [Marivirga arenosa]|uniref:L-2-hydroxyglutarate oxidase n=1 Tax=Marivirga arenosa TaxID=3059076 RepID=A0AA51N5X0_9BACT|nr:MULTISPECIES: L-2-hydroxyglutarate oxidase [unclassified Marivirga]WMN06837.1 L-2-hydroxyglutarate oxidase [Marivirga sp. ABR2-2]WNB16837.1 L-2-hydroxyglutarate oxidase [Marivirga sp. BKB1-2]
MKDIIIVGGGIVGLATALKIKQKNSKLSVLLLEKEEKLAQHQTGNNSGVIHSGVYYKPGSLKAKNCIDGYNQLLKFCDEEGVPYELCGKVIVATDKSELPTLSMIEERGNQNGLSGLLRLTKEEVKEREPYVNGIAGIYVPQTGIIDYTAVSLKYAEKFQELGGEIILSQKVTDIQEKGGVTTVITNNNSYETKLVVNCAGLYSDKIAKLTTEKLDLKIIPFRGEYFMIKPEKQYLIKNLVYPVPDPNFPFLGVHFTRMINGGIEAGPNAVLAFKREGYRKSLFNLVELGESLAWPGFQKVAAKYWKTGFGEMYRSFSKSAFTTALQKLLPDITESDLTPGGAGVRAQACDRNGGLIDDFLILEESNAVNVCNAPSPAATSSLSIGDHVSDLALKRF